MTQIMQMIGYKKKRKNGDKMSELPKQSKQNKSFLSERHVRCRHKRRRVINTSGGFRRSFQRGINKK